MESSPLLFLFGGGVEVYGLLVGDGEYCLLLEVGGGPMSPCLGGVGGVLCLLLCGDGVLILLPMKGIAFCLLRGPVSPLKGLKVWSLVRPNCLFKLGFLRSLM